MSIKTWEVGVDLQTLYVFPEAETKEEAEALAREMARKEFNLDESLYDYYPTSSDIINEEDYNLAGGE